VSRSTRLGLIAALVVAIGIGYVVGRSAPDGDAVAQDARAIQGNSDREVYFPGTEALAPDEMRIISCGTGMHRVSTSRSLPNIRGMPIID